MSPFHLNSSNLPSLDVLFSSYPPRLLLAGFKKPSLLLSS